jgi:uncharacterized membrane protein
MRQRNFWNGFGVGAASGAAVAVAGAAAWRMIAAARNRRILRLQSSIQIGRPVNEVFNVWHRLQELPRFSHVIKEVQVSGMRSHWRVAIDGRQFQWDAELIQVVPNEALGWKSISGPKHSGRISFSPLLNETMVHITMNYAPRMRLFSRALTIGEHLQQIIERVLRDFKAAMEEGKGAELPLRATGTAPTEQMQHSRFGGATSPIEATRPADPSPFFQPEIKR